MKEKIRKRKKVIITILVVCALIAVAGITYAFITQVLTGEKQVVINAGVLDLVLEEENAITISDALPMYDQVGMIQEDVFEFRLVNKTSNSTNYVLSLNDVTDERKCGDLGEITIDSPTNCRKVGYPIELREAALNICKDWYSEVITEAECLQAEEEEGYTFDEFEAFIDYLIKGEKMLDDTRTVVETYPDNNYTIVYDQRLDENDVKYYLTKEGIGKPKRLSNLVDGIIDSGTIAGNGTIDYSLRLWIDSEVTDESKIAGKSLSYKLNVKVEQNPTISKSQVTLPSNDYTRYYADKYRSNIKTIEFIPTLTTIEDTVEAWDLSKNGDGSFMAYITELRSGGYNLTLTSSDEMYLPEDSSDLFGNFALLTEIIGLEYVNTSQVKNMSYMFWGGDYCESNLQKLNLSNFDTSNVTDMSYMFYGCRSLTNLDLSNFDTSNVTHMYSMFFDCRSLTNLDLSNFDTSNITYMDSMFSGCRSLTNLDLSNFDTSNVTYMGSMFSDCRSLTNLDLSNFDTSNVTYMDNMFYGCINLTTTLKIVGLGSSNPYYYDMFYNTSIDSGTVTVYSDGTNDELVQKMVNTKSSNSNVVYGGVAQ